MLIFCPLISFADFGESFLVIDCNKDKYFSITSKVIWNNVLESLTHEISEHDGVVKQDNKELKHIITVGGDVESKCWIDNQQLEARFYSLETDMQTLDLVKNGNIEATYKSQGQDQFIDVNELNKFEVRYTSKSGWEFFCGNGSNSTRWRKAGEGANDKELRDECGINRAEYKYLSGQEWRHLRLMRPMCSAAISHHQSDLVKAIKNGKISKALKLLKVTNNLNYIGKGQKQQPLHWAVEKRNLPLVKALLEHGANPNAVNCRGETAIVTVLRLRDAHSSIGTDYGLDVIRMLLQHGANPDAMSIYRQNPALSFAASHGDIKAMTVLLDAGADPNLTNDSLGPSLPIFSALGIFNKNQFQTLQLLIEKGANPNSRSSDYTILSEAIGCTSPHAKDEDLRLLLVKFLLEHGADPNLPANGNMPLACASSHGFEKIKKELQFFGAK